MLKTLIKTPTFKTNRLKKIASKTTNKLTNKYNKPIKYNELNQKDSEQFQLQMQNTKLILGFFSFFFLSFAVIVIKQSKEYW